jgi:hypothetical protein
MSCGLLAEVELMVVCGSHLLQVADGLPCNLQLLLFGNPHMA